MSLWPRRRKPDPWRIRDLELALELREPDAEDRAGYSDKPGAVIYYTPTATAAPPTWLDQQPEGPTWTT